MTGGGPAGPSSGYPSSGFPPHRARPVVPGEGSTLFVRHVSVPSNMWRPSDSSSSSSTIEKTSLTKPIKTVVPEESSGRLPRVLPAHRLPTSWETSGGRWRHRSTPAPYEEDVLERKRQLPRVLQSRLGSWRPSRANAKTGTVMPVVGGMPGSHFRPGRGAEDELDKRLHMIKDIFGNSSELESSQMSSTLRPISERTLELAKPRQLASMDYREFDAFGPPVKRRMSPEAAKKQAESIERLSKREEPKGSTRVSPPPKTKAELSMPKPLPPVRRKPKQRPAEATSYPPPQQSSNQNAEALQGSAEVPEEEVLPAEAEAENSEAVAANDAAAAAAPTSAEGLAEPETEVFAPSPAEQTEEEAAVAASEEAAAAPAPSEPAGTQADADIEKEDEDKDAASETYSDDQDFEADEGSDPPSESGRASGLQVETEPLQDGQAPSAGSSPVADSPGSGLMSPYRTPQTASSGESVVVPIPNGEAKTSSEPAQEASASETAVLEQVPEDSQEGEGSNADATASAPATADVDAPKAEESTFEAGAAVEQEEGAPSAEELEGPLPAVAEANENEEQQPQEPTSMDEAADGDDGAGEGQESLKGPEEAADQEDGLNEGSDAITGETEAAEQDVIKDRARSAIEMALFAEEEATDEQEATATEVDEQGPGAAEEPDVIKERAKSAIEMALFAEDADGEPRVDPEDPSADEVIEGKQEEQGIDGEDALADEDSAEQAVIKDRARSAIEMALFAEEKESAEGKAMEAEEEVSSGEAAGGEEQEEIKERAKSAIEMALFAEDTAEEQEASPEEDATGPSEGLLTDEAEQPEEHREVEDTAADADEEPAVIKDRARSAIEMALFADEDSAEQDEQLDDAAAERVDEEQEAIKDRARSAMEMALFADDEDTREDQRTAEEVNDQKPSEEEQESSKEQAKSAIEMALFDGDMLGQDGAEEQETHPEEVQPVEVESDTAIASATAPPPSVQQFGADYYPLHFRHAGTEAFAAIHAKFAPRTEEAVQSREPESAPSPEPEPASSPAAPAELQPSSASPPVGEDFSAAYYSMHFRDAGSDAFAAIHRKFAAEDPTSNASAAPMAASVLSSSALPAEVPSHQEVESAQEVAVPLPAQLTIGAEYYDVHFRHAGLDAFSAIHARFAAVPSEAPEAAAENTALPQPDASEAATGEHAQDVATVVEVPQMVVANKSQAVVVEVLIGVYRAVDKLVAQQAQVEAST